MASQRTKNENYTNMKKKVTDIFNQSVKCKKWYNEDIQRVHRLGRPVNNKPRPIIVRFLLFEDKLMVLKSRADLKIINLGMSNDLTVKQRQELKKPKRKWQERALYKWSPRDGTSTNRVHRNIPCNGRLVMESVPTDSTGTSRVMVAS